MVWMRRLGWAAAALPVLGVLALAVAAVMFDGERVRQLAADEVRQRYARTLTLAQPPALALWPRPRLRVDGVTLSEPRSPQVFLRVAAAEVTPRLWPLLQGRVEVDAIELQGVQATVITRRDGTRNIDDLAGGPAAPGAASAPAGGGTPVAIDRLRLRDLDLTLRDAAGSDTRLKLALLEAADLRAQDGSLAVAPLVLELQELQAGALKLEPSRLAVERLNAGRDGLELQGLTLAARGRQGELAFEAGLRWPRLGRQGKAWSGSPLEGEFKTSGPTALSGTLRSAAPAGDAQVFRLPGLALTAKGRSGALALDAALQSDLAWQAGVLDWTLKGAVNDNRLDAQGQLRLGGDRPHLRATARFDRLDLNRLLAPAAASAPPAAAPAPAETPIDLAGLRALDGQFSLSAGTLQFRPFRFDEARLEAQLAGGRLRVDRLSGRAWGGQVEARGSAEAEGSRLALALTASGVDVNALLRDVAGKDLLEGRGRITADVRGQGRTLGALRSSLTGQAALQLRDGAVKGLNLAQAFRQARAALAGRQDAISQARTTEKTDFSELSASARIEGGVARSDDLDLKSPFLRVGGAGQFEIGRGQVDYTARATVVAVPQGQDAGGLASLKGVTVPVQLTGPFDAIAWKIQWSGVAAAAVEKKVKEKVEQKLGDKLGDKLKGLFGR